MGKGWGETKHIINHKACCPRMKILKWWEDRHIPKARETPISQKPELPEEPETAMESEAKTPGPQLEVSPWA